MNRFEKKSVYNADDLVEIMRLLRGKDGCPWDREQTHLTIKPNFVEEVYEVVEAIDAADDSMLKEELGDVMLQVVFHAQMAAEEGRFDINDVYTGICNKLIMRHPHIFSDTIASTSGEVLKNWDEIKKKEKGHDTVTESMRSVSASFPALMRAQKIQKKAAKVGFDWSSGEGARQKLVEETGEVEEAVLSGDSAHIAEEVGDMLFAMVNWARFLHVDCETALQKACEKFISRFSYIENHAKIRYNRHVDELSLNEADVLWEECKQQEKTQSL